MEKVFVIRNILHAATEFENRFERLFFISLNESMLLYYLTENGRLSSGEIASLLELTTSNTSKVIKAAEQKGLIHRILGNIDKRQMYFSMTSEGNKKLAEVKSGNIDISKYLEEFVNKIAT